MSEWSDVDSDEEGFAREFGAPLGLLRARGSQCPKPDLVLAERAGVLPAAIAGDVAAHVAGCALCQALARDLSDEVPGPTVEEERRMRATIVARRPPPVREAPRRAWTWLWHPAPAFAVLALVVAGMAWLSREAIAPPLAPPQTAARPPAAAPATPPAMALPLDKPPVRLPLADALVWRGDSGDRRPHLEALGRALAPYRTDDFVEASTRLEVLSRTDRSPDVLFYLGVCRLFVGRAAEAVTALEQAARRADEPLRAESSWYLAVAYERAGRPADARSRLQTVCDTEGTDHRAAACDALRRAGETGR